MRTARLRGLSRRSGVPVRSEEAASKAAASRVGPRLLLLLGRSILRLPGIPENFAVGVGAADTTKQVHEETLTCGVGVDHELAACGMRHGILPSACQNSAPQ